MLSAKARRRLRLAALLLAACVVVIVAALVRSRVWYYDVRSGALRELVTYRLALLGADLKIVTTRDRRIGTGVSAYVLGTGEPPVGPVRWRMMTRRESGPFSVITAKGCTPWIIQTYDVFETYFRPLLSEDEYRVLVKAALDPTTSDVVNLLLTHTFLEAMDHAEGTAAKRKLVRKRLGPVWSQCVSERASDRPAEAPQRQPSEAAGPQSNLGKQPGSP